MKKHNGEILGLTKEQIGKFKAAIDLLKSGKEVQEKPSHLRLVAVDGKLL